MPFSTTAFAIGDDPGELRPFRGRCAVVAEDDPHFRSLVTETLVGDGFDTIDVANGSGLLEVLELARRGLVRCDVVITDLFMPGMSGLELLEWTVKWRTRPPLIAMSGFASSDLSTEVRKLGAIGPLIKPFDLADLRTVVWNAVGRRR